MNVRPWLGVGFCVVSLALAGACGSSDQQSGFADGDDGGADDGSTADGGGGPDTGGLTDNAPVSIAIEPPDPVIEVVNGVIPPAFQFKIIAKAANGAPVPTSGTWAFDRFDVATINAANGALTATGFVGGTGTVSVSVGALAAKTTATVKLHYTSDPNNLDPNVKAKFAAASQPDPALSLLYPYDKTVFPRGLLGPTLQWQGGAANDVYYLHATSKAFEYEAWTTAAPPSRYDFPATPADIWRKLTDSTSGDVTLAIQRYDGTNAYLGKSQTWTVAPADLAGTIYYWQVNSGDVVRIKPGAAQSQSFLQKPSGVTCVACHSVSKNGQRLVASFNGGQSPWGDFDAPSGANQYASGQNSGFEAISPDGAFVLWGQWTDGTFDGSGAMTLSPYNALTPSATLNPGGGNPAHPTWSGDGKRIAFSVRTDGNGLDFTTSTLWTADVDTNAMAFANVHKIVDNAPGRPVVTYPAFSPDSQWIAFERSTQARSRGAQAEIWMSKADGTGQISLDTTNGVGVIPQTNANYEPTFMPVAVGGYFWLVIVSERVYGNTLTNTDPTSRNKQLWVTAIDAQPQAGKDPSHPAFWLPGQDLNNNNMRGEWALDPCKKLGESCNAGYECCDGFCRTDDGGAPVCVKPAGCASTGDACQQDTDCCDSSQRCLGGFCVATPK